MPHVTLVRPIQQADLPAWKPLWDGYNAFHGREGETALPDEVTQATWQRFYDPNEPVFALVAECDGGLVGITHYLFHRSTTRLELTCYLQDLFTLPAERGLGVGRTLIQGVYEKAESAGIKRVYWQTHETNAAGRMLYEKVAKSSASSSTRTTPERFSRVRACCVQAGLGRKCISGSAAAAFTSPSEKLVCRSFTCGRCRSVSRENFE